MSQVQGLFMKFFLVLAILVVSKFSYAIDYQGGDIHANDSKWMNANLYHGIDQRGGPFKFTDTYLELEFGGRSGIVDYYGYVDFLDILNDSESDRHDGDNSFAKVDLRFSLDAMFKKDLALGAVKEWYIATEYMDGDTALRVFWLGLGTDIELPWLGLVGFNVQTRYYMENFGASNEEKFDGIVLHVNWFKPFSFFGKDFIAFQGYADYEFFSKLNDTESSFYSDDSFQTYLGFWYHSKRYALGYGAKIYKNMTQFKDGASFFTGGPKFDTTGVGHYFNVTYKF